METINKNELIAWLEKRIEEFLLNHARPNPNYEDEDDNKYTSPDADEMATIAKMLKAGQRPCKCTSSFLHGDYTPNTDGVRGIHDELKREINELREVQKRQINIAYGQFNEPK